ncbi:hypothetical protein REMIM1_CH00844 [Rhizobium etli bv. mimosae str. Mim1]|nr:hypothetical protein REMIM1_CH00844 [Rhizobium etli bv. mimosae str. Mim1]
MVSAASFERKNRGRRGIASHRILLFLFPAKTPMNRPDEKISAGDHDTNYRPGLPRALSGREVRVFGA